MFRTKKNEINILDIQTKVDDFINTDLEMNIKKTYLNSWNKEQQLTCIWHMKPRSSMIFSKINIANISAMAGNPNGMMIAYDNNYPSLIGFDGKQTLVRCEEKKQTVCIEHVLNEYLKTNQQISTEMF